LAEIEKEVVYAQVDKSTKSTTKKDGDRDKTLSNDLTTKINNHFVIFSIALYSSLSMITGECFSASCAQL
jgi:hypothetical protein